MPSEPDQDSRGHNSEYNSASDSSYDNIEANENGAPSPENEDSGPLGNGPAEDPEPDPGDQDYTAVLRELAELREGMGRLEAVFEKRLSYDKSKEEAFERLYTEMEAHKENRAFDQLQPLLFDLILLYDRIGNALNGAGEADSGSGFLSSITEEIIEILARRGVEKIEILGDEFDPKIQHAVGVEETENPDKHNKIGSVVRTGFRRGNRIVRPVEIVVLKYQDSQ